jgi:plastocyanin
MRYAIPGLAVLALLTVLQPHARCEPATGSISGVVRYTGTVPKPQIITTTEGTQIEHNDLVVDPKSKGLRSVVLVLEDAPAQPKVKDAKPVVMDQVAMVFTPRVVAVQHGQAVRFDNNDNSNHSVMASSLVPADNFNLFVLQGKPFDHVFAAQKFPVQIGCSLNAWMRAWVYVVPHPWFAVSDAQGRFRIANVPPGKYTLLLRHADAGHLERRTVTVEAGKTVELDIEWEKVGK